MVKNKKTRVLKFAKIFAVIMIVTGIIYLLTLIPVVGNYEKIGNYYKDLSLMISVVIVFVAYCFLGGIFLYKLEKWALYLVTVPAIIILFWEIFKNLFFFLYGYDEDIFISNLAFVVKIVFGLSSIYLIRNRQYFNENKK